MANDWDESPGGAAKVGNLVVALLVHVVLGLPWVGIVAAVAWLSGGEVALVWGLCGLGLWTIGLVDAVRTSDRPGATWGAVLKSWLWILGGPLSVAIVGIQRFPGGGGREAPLPRPVPVVQAEPEEEQVNPALARRLDEVERRLRELGHELAEIRRLAETGESVVGEAVAPPERARDWEPRVPTPAPQAPAKPPPPPVAPPAPPTAPREPSWWERDIDWADLLGAKGLAWAGGAVTVLGVVFFFVLAVDRGWIGPGERVMLGALASALVFCGGLFLHRRFGPTYSAFAAVGAGLAGGYATLLASAALYDLVSDPAALAIAAAIASVGLATSLLWSSEFVAGIGLVGAALVPLMVLFEEDLSPLGTGFAGLVFVAIAVVAVVKRWPTLAALGLAATLPQIALLVGQGSVTDWDRAILAWAFSAAYVAAGIALHRAVDEDGLGSLPATLAILAGVLAGATGFALFEGADRGWIVVGAGVVYCAVGAALLRDRDVSALHVAIGLALIGVGLAVVLSGPSLALAWAAEAAVLAWLATRIEEPRYQLFALLYLAAAAVHAIAIDAPPSDLYEAASDPADGALAPLAIAVSAAVVAFFSRPWADEPTDGIFRALEPLLARFRAAAPLWRTLAAWLSGTAALYAASLGILELAQLSSDDVDAAFERGQVAVTALWGATAAALTYSSRWLRSFQIRPAGLALACATFAQAAVFDATLEETPRGWAMLAAAVALLLTALAEELPALDEEPELSISALLLVPAAAGLGLVGLYFVTDAEGYAWLGEAAVFAALAALVFRSDRDFSTLLWVPAVVLGALAAADLLEGTWLVLAWSAAAVAVSLLGDRVGEERLQLGAAGYLALALGYTLVELAPPGDFFTANADPAAGVPALLCSLAAAVVLTVVGLRSGRLAEFRPYAAVGTAVLALYAASLVILGAFEWAGPADVETDFQRGHSAVSAFWGIVGLLTLYVGLTRDLRALRIAGFALFGIALAKIFLYDLANLSSVTRALSFLAVGAVLLLAGFFYQRLTATAKKA
ncbi:MAG TPA: DUF2339 domain-containing protein [Gaiellaceae bacterium]|nr:DUF2339 domain-containing protein [Gaiellaceae bacterium]